MPLTLGLGRQRQESPEFKSVLQRKFQDSQSYKKKAYLEENKNKKQQATLHPSPFHLTFTQSISHLHHRSMTYKFTNNLSNHQIHSPNAQ